MGNNSVQHKYKCIYYIFKNAQLVVLIVWRNCDKTFVEIAAVCVHQILVSPNHRYKLFHTFIDSILTKNTCIVYLSKHNLMQFWSVFLKSVSLEVFTNRLWLHLFYTLCLGNYTTRKHSRGCVEITQSVRLSIHPSL